MPRLGLLLAMLALLAGCGSEEPTATRTDRQPAAPPSSERPEPPSPSGPPPAWLETELGSFWLGYSTFCWGGTCADYIAPSCEDDRHTPRIVVHRGERVTAHLGFEPREVTLTWFPGHSQERLEATRDTSWQADREGAFALFTVPEDRGDASYVACLRFDG